VEVEDVGVEPQVRSARPLLRVVRGEPDDVELAAVTVVLTGVAARAGEGVQPSAPRSTWADRAALLRRPLSHGPGAWRSSALPH
jgi:hypothetical protein